MQEQPECTIDMKQERTQCGRNNEHGKHDDNQLNQEQDTATVAKEIEYRNATTMAGNYGHICQICVQILKPYPNGLDR